MQEIKNLTKLSIEENMLLQWEKFDVGNIAVFENESDFTNMADELGLQGQKDLIASSNEKVIPFMRMTGTEIRIWENYCPQKQNLEDFRTTIIPYEIMELLKQVKDKMYFDWIEIWSETREDIDPIIVGHVYRDEAARQSKSKYNSMQFLVARWGHSLRKFEEIVDIVKTNWLRKRKNALSSLVNNLELDADKYFSGQSVTTYLE